MKQMDNEDLLLALDDYVSRIRDHLATIEDIEDSHVTEQVSRPVEAIGNVVDELDRLSDELRCQIVNW